MTRRGVIAVILIAAFILGTGIVCADSLFGGMASGSVNTIKEANAITSDDTNATLFGGINSGTIDTLKEARAVTNNATNATLFGGITKGAIDTIPEANNVTNDATNKSLFGGMGAKKTVNGSATAPEYAYK